MLRLVGGHLVDSSGTPVLAVSAIEDSPDGWIAIESGDALANTDDSAGASDGNNADSMPVDNAHDLSTSVEFSDASEISGDNAASNDDRSEQKPN